MPKTGSSTQMNNGKATSLGAAVHYWLSFQLLCGREQIFSEAYLSQPIAEFLSEHFRGHIHSEANHPLYKPKNGRPRQVDFALLRLHKQDFTSVIECKWVTDRDTSKQAIVDDLLRLECIRNESFSVDRYFLLAGKTGDLEEHFWSLKCGKGRQSVPFAGYFFDDKLSLTPRKVPIKVGSPPSIAPLFSEYEKDFGEPAPSTMYTTLLFRSPANEKICVLVWKVGSAPGSQAIGPAPPTSDMRPG
jgi:hypothetical protein